MLDTIDHIVNDMSIDPNEFLTLLNSNQRK